MKPACVARRTRDASLCKLLRVYTVACAFVLLGCLHYAFPTGRMIHLSPVRFAHARVRRYEETVVLVDWDASGPTPPQWSTYDGNAVLRGNYSKMASQADDLRVYDPLNFCAPFFQMENAQFYISPNGFLGLSPYDRCGVFCYTANPPFGGYGFSPSSPTTGDFPIIGLYVTDLNPRGSPSNSGIYTWLGKKNSTNTMGSGLEEVAVAIVDWNNIEGYGRAGGSLRGQIELWANGTIILRYRSVPSMEVSYEQQTFPAGTGLIWTRAQRSVRTSSLRRPDGSLAVAAIRYDPIPDPCAPHTSCIACAGANVTSSRRIFGQASSTAYGGCVWCQLTQECVSEDVADDVCSSADRNQCVPPTLNTSGPIPQAFYVTSMARGPALNSIANHPDAKRIASGDLPARIPLGFFFPFFGSPQSTVPPSNRSEQDASGSGSSYQSVTLGTDLTLNITGVSQRCVRQGLSAYIYSTNEYFRSIGGQCRGGEYLGSIVPYGTSLSFMNQLRIHVLELPPRPQGSDFCPNASGTSAECPQTFVLQVFGANIYAHVVNARVSFQVVLGADGVVNVFYGDLFDEDSYFRQDETRCAANTAWNQYYVPYAGLFRYGAPSTDPSSVLVPWTLLTTNARVSFTPIHGCPDCMGRGYCDRDSSRCVCKENFDGPECSACAPGFFGPQCTRCSTCENGGRCLDGISGSGFCDCPAPYGGADCSTRCGAGSTQCEEGCGMGFCSCGVCECPKGTGYFGARCERWADPCRRFSLDGCSACVSAGLDQPAQCEWCTSSSLCVASWQQKFSLPVNLTRPTCLSRIALDRQSACTMPVVRLPSQGNFALITLIVIFACVALCAVLVLGAVCLCRRRPYNPLVLGAVPGVPNFTFPHREREIIGISRLPIQGKGRRPVQGIPLRQIPMAELVKWQRSERLKSTDAENDMVSPDSRYRANAVPSEVFTTDWNNHFSGNE